MNGTYGWYSVRARAAFVSLALVLATPFAAAQSLPTVQARFSSDTIDLRIPGIVTVTLTATTGDLAGCTLSNLRIGTAAPIIVAPSADRRLYKVAFNKSDLTALLPGFDSAPAIVTGNLLCNGSSSLMMAHANARVLKANVVQARVKPILTLAGNTFKDLNSNGQLDAYEDWRLPVAQRVEDLLSRMTLAEKAGLMNALSYSEGATNSNNILNQHIRYLILRQRPAIAQLATNLNNAQTQAEGTRLGIPLVITSNPLNTLGGGNAVFEPGGGPGQFSVWPGTLGLAATNNIQLIRDFADITRVEWRNAGIRRMYGMQVDLITEPRWTRNRTTFTESPQWAAAITRAMVLGYQGPSVGFDSVAEVIKHFPGDGAVLRGKDPHDDVGQFAVYPTTGSLFTYQVPAFQAAVDAGVSAIMPYYNAQNNALSPVPQIPSDWWVSPAQQFEEVGGAFSTQILTKLLRERMGFKGVINTDSGILTNRAWGVQSLTLEQRWAKAVKAGSNILSETVSPAGLLGAVNQGLLSEAELAPSVRQLLTEIFNLGLFENPYVDPATAQQIANSAASQAVADEAHRQSIVLMRNDRDLLPLESPVKLYVEVFTAGAGAATQTAALKALFANDPLVTIVNDVAQANAAFVWLYPSEQELAQEVNIDLGTATGINVARVQQIEAAVPTILAVNFSNPWPINAVEPAAAAVIGTFDVKAQAVIDLVRGRFLPSGKLPVSVPASNAAVQANASDVPGYAESFDYVYRNAVNDRYVFGFGLSDF